MITPGAPLLRTDGLVKRFGGLLATDHVSLTLLPGEVHALIGPNGAGKTTLIGQLSGELFPDGGTIRLGDHDITRQSVDARARLGLARSYQITQICHDFTALQNVSLAALAGNQRAGQSGESGASGNRSIRGYGFWRPLMRDIPLVERAREALDDVGLGHRAGTLVGEMAHGEHRQLELAMALALRPRLLLLDEPLAGMSGAESETMIALLERLKGRYPMLLVEHDMAAVFSLADRISVLVYGRVIASDAPERIRNDPEVRMAYLGDEEVPTRAPGPTAA